MRTFKLYRPNPPEGYVAAGQANLPDEMQLQGVHFDDDTVVVRWFTLEHSTAIFPSWTMFEQIHGHPEYGTRIEWSD